MHLSPLLLALAATLVMATGAAGAGLCDDFYARLPNVSRALCESAELQAGAARSVKGRAIYTRDVGPVAAPLRVLVVGAMHGDELSSTSLARRVNANGVDLNRNFPTPNWALENAVYWEKRVRKDPRRWPGKRALSEPESRFLFDQMQSFRPDLVVSIHAPYGVLDFDGPVVTIELANAQRTPTNAEMHRMWRDLQQWIGQTIIPAGTRQAAR